VGGGGRGEGGGLSQQFPLQETTQFPDMLRSQCHEEDDPKVLSSEKDLAEIRGSFDRSSSKSEARRFLELPDTHADMRGL
jgi:hypothetical protein